MDSTHQRMLDLMVRGAAIHKQDTLFAYRAVKLSDACIISTGSYSLQDGVENAVSDLLEALLRCDTARLSSSILSDPWLRYSDAGRAWHLAQRLSLAKNKDLRKVLPSYLDGSNPSILSFVESRGVEALSRHGHCLQMRVCEFKVSRKPVVPDPSWNGMHVVNLSLG